MFHEPGTPEAEYSDTLELDLSTVEPSLAGPKRPQDRVPLQRRQGVVPEGAQGDAGRPCRRRPRRRSADRQSTRRRRGARGTAPPVAPRPHRPTAMPREHLTPRLGRDRRDHELHEHVEPLGDDRRRPAGQEGRRARALDQALGQGQPGARLEGRDRLPQATPGSTPTSTRFGSTSSATAARPASATPARCPPEISKAIHDNDLVAVAVLCGNRNFEGRINPDVRANYLASPPLVVAYALAGTMDIDLADRAARQRPPGQAGLPQGHLADPARGPGDRS